MFGRLALAAVRFGRGRLVERADTYAGAGREAQPVTGLRRAAALNRRVTAHMLHPFTPQERCQPRVTQRQGQHFALA